MLRIAALASSQHETQTKLEDLRLRHVKLTSAVTTVIEETLPKITEQLTALNDVTTELATNQRALIDESVNTKKQVIEIDEALNDHLETLGVWQKTVEDAIEAWGQSMKNLRSDFTSYITVDQEQARVMQDHTKKLDIKLMKLVAYLEEMENWLISFPTYPLGIDESVMMKDD